MNKESVVKIVSLTSLVANSMGVAFAFDQNGKMDACDDGEKMASYIDSEFKKINDKTCHWTPYHSCNKPETKPVHHSKAKGLLKDEIEAKCPDLSWEEIYEIAGELYDDDTGIKFGTDSSSYQFRTWMHYTKRTTKVYVDDCADVVESIDLKKCLRDNL